MPHINTCAILSLGLKNTLNSQFENFLSTVNSLLYKIDTEDEEQIISVVKRLTDHISFMMVDCSMLEKYSKEFFITLGNFLPLILVLDDGHIRKDVLSLSPFSYSLTGSSDIENAKAKLITYISYFNERTKHLFYKRKELECVELYLKERNDKLSLANEFLSKNHAYNFLLESIQRINSSKNIQELFKNTRYSIENILPLDSMHIAFWNKEYSNIHYYLGVMENDISARIEWKKYLNSLVKPILTKMQYENKEYNEVMYPGVTTFANEDNFIISPSQTHLMETYTLNSFLPDCGYITSIPLKVLNEQRGALILHLKSDYRLTIDLKNSLNLISDTISNLFNNYYILENVHKEDFVDNTKRIVQVAPILRQ